MTSFSWLHYLILPFQLHSLFYRTLSDMMVMVRRAAVLNQGYMYLHWVGLSEASLRDAEMYCMHC